MIVRVRMGKVEGGGGGAKENECEHECEREGQAEAVRSAARRAALTLVLGDGDAPSHWLLLRISVLAECSAGERDDVGREDLEVDIIRRDGLSRRVEPVTRNDSTAAMATAPVAMAMTIDLALTSTTSLSAPARTTLELSELHGAARAHG